MNFFNIFKLSVVFFAFFIFPEFHYAQSGAELEEGYYVVIGVYSQNKESYAQKYTHTVSDGGYDVSYGLNSTKGFYYVYVYSSNNIQSAIRRMRQTRQNKKFGDAWVFVCDGGVNNTVKNRAVTHAGSEAGANEPDQTNAQASREKPKPGQQDPAKTASAVAGEVEEASAKMVEETVENEQASNSAVPEDGGVATLSDLKVYLNLFNARNNEEVAGNVQVIDTEKGRYLKTENGGENISITRPQGEAGRISLICDVFGFRKQQKEISYFNPLNDTTRGYVDYADGVYTVDFDLVRYRAGDIAVMYNVSFFRDAAIMRPESKYEVNSLLEMMEENPELKIRIHGHVNGRQPGKIIDRGASDNYFALSNENKQNFGTAKDLSRKRAELIRLYLIDQGIGEDRMEIKAWGGKRMLYDKLSTRADENVRVEIEILEE